MPLASFRRNRPRLFWGLVVSVMAVFYLGSLAVYASSTDDRDEVVAIHTDHDEVAVIVTPTSLHPASGRLDVEVTIGPGSDFSGPDGETLAVPISLHLAPSTSRTELVFPAGAVPTTFDAQLMVQGQAGRWPLDRFDVAPMVVAAYTGTGDGVEIHRSSVYLDDNVEGWTVRSDAVGVDEEFASSTTVHLARGVGTLVYSAILLLMMAVLAALAAFVAVQTARRRRRVHTDMLSWMAAMLFAVIPLRGILPGNPPIGSWVDIALTMWVVVTLVGSLTVYVLCWWRDTAAESSRGASGDGGQMRGARHRAGLADATTPEVDGDGRDDGDRPPHVGRGEELIPHGPAGSLPTSVTEAPVRGDHEYRPAGDHAGAEDQAAPPVRLDADEQQQRGHPDPVV
ncbi:hypothetical protein J2X34_004951 [Rhodococcus sp. BE178]